MQLNFKTKPNCLFAFLSIFSFFIFHFSLMQAQVKCIPDTAYYATYFDGIDISYSIAHDNSGNTYITGLTEDSTSSIATKGAYQTSYGGNRGDAFLAKFNCAGGLEWATYFGGKGIDEGDAVAVDDSGNIYLTGQTNSATGIATKGTYQTAFAGKNGFLAKFNANGALQWSTYYGGNGGGIAIDEHSGNIYLTGGTYNNSGVATTGAFQTSLMGMYDAFLAKFSPSGSLLWGTYYGEASFIGGVGAALDSSGNVYFTGTTSTFSGMATNGAYQTSGDTIWDDVFLAKFSGSGSRLWATYYGGPGLEECRAVATDGANVYITGSTKSGTGIATAGAYQTSYAGGVYFGDAFIAKFSSSGSILWGTYFGGSNDDGAFGISVDSIGNVYIAGQSNSLSGIITKNAYQDTGNSINGDAMVAKFSSAGSLEYGTYYGSVGEVYGLGTDNAGNAYITGGGIIVPSSNAYQTNSDGIFWAKIPTVRGTSTGISPVNNNIANISIYPNPTSSTLNIESGSNIIQSITIFDIAGREVYKSKNLKSLNQSINVNNFPSGIYIVKLDLENGSYMGKFVKE